MLTRNTNHSFRYELGDGPRPQKYGCANHTVKQGILGFGKFFVVALRGDKQEAGINDGQRYYRYANFNNTLQYL